MQLDEYLPVLEKTNARFADAAAEAVLAHGWSAHVPGCPGWRLADLVWHLSEVQHFWAWIVRTRATTRRPTSIRPPPRRRAARLARRAVRGAGDGAGRRRSGGARLDLGAAAGRRVRAPAGRSRRRPCTPSTSSRCWATSDRSRPTWASTASTSGWRSWCRERCPTVLRRDAHPVVFHAVDADAVRTLFPGTRPFPIAALTGTAGDLLLAAWRRVPLEVLTVDGDRLAGGRDDRPGQRRVEAGALTSDVVPGEGSRVRASTRHGRRARCGTSSHHGASRSGHGHRPGLVSTLLPFVLRPGAGSRGAPRALRAQNDMAGPLGEPGDPARARRLHHAQLVRLEGGAGRVVPTWNYVTAHVYGSSWSTTTSRGQALVSRG